MADETDERGDLNETAAQAMEQTLYAERQVLAALADCQRQAAQIVSDARDTVATIRQRAEGRLLRLHRRRDQRISAVREAADRAMAQMGDPAEFDELSEADLRRAAETLAAELTGGRAE